MNIFQIIIYFLGLAYLIPCVLCIGGLLWAEEENEIEKEDVIVCFIPIINIALSIIFVIAISGIALRSNK